MTKQSKREAEERAQREQDVAHRRSYDEGKIGINGCDGAFEPENRQPHGALRPRKTWEDRIPVDQRPRVIEARKRAERMRDGKRR